MKMSNLKELLSPTGRAVLKMWRTSKDFRDAYVEEDVYTVFADQVSAMRKKRGLTQSQLAKLAGTHQSNISEIENPSGTGPTISTMLKVSSAFDVALSVKMMSYSEYLKGVTEHKDYNIISFDEDDIVYDPDYVIKNWDDMVGVKSESFDFSSCDNLLQNAELAERELSKCN